MVVVHKALCIFQVASKWVDVVLERERMAMRVCNAEVTAFIASLGLHWGVRVQITQSLAVRVSEEHAFRYN